MSNAAGTGTGPTGGSADQTGDPGGAGAPGATGTSGAEARAAGGGVSLSRWEMGFLASVLVVLIGSMIPLVSLRLNVTLWSVFNLFFVGVGVILPLVAAAFILTRGFMGRADQGPRLGSLGTDQTAHVASWLALGFYFISFVTSLDPVLFIGLVGSLGMVLTSPLVFLLEAATRRTTPAPHPGAPAGADTPAASGDPVAPATAGAAVGAGASVAPAAAVPAAEATPAQGPAEDARITAASEAAEAPEGSAMGGRSAADAAADAEAEAEVAAGAEADADADVETDAEAAAASAESEAPADAVDAPEPADMESAEDAEDAEETVLSDDAARADHGEDHRSVEEPVEDVEARGAGGAREPEYDAFWFAVGTHRVALDPEGGRPLFDLEPGGWILALEDRGNEFLVQNTDGATGVLRDLTDIERA